MCVPLYKADRSNEGDVEQVHIHVVTLPPLLASTDVIALKDADCDKDSH